MSRAESCLAARSSWSLPLRSVGVAALTRVPPDWHGYPGRQDLAIATGGSRMAELTVREEKLAEVIGLAMAAEGATEKVGGLTEDAELADKLEQMNEEARETEKRGTEIAEGFDGKKTAVLEKARETKGEATQMMTTYLGDDAEALD